MRIAHLSDIHVSRDGKMVQSLRMPQREAEEPGWETIRELPHGWRIDMDRADDDMFRWRDRVRLVDELGLVHETWKITRSLSLSQAIAKLEEQQLEMWRLTAASLAADFPEPEELKALLERDPANTNLRFCAVAHQLRTDAPDVVIITGDLTDDGDGYELVAAGMQPWIEKGKLVCIPGNHDIYALPSMMLPRPLRRTEAEKRRAWGRFCATIGIPSGGGFLYELGEDVVAVCLDSCLPPSLPGSASGAIDEDVIHRLAGELDVRKPRVAIACLHHHVVNPPLDATGGAPSQTGMQLRNARRVHELLKDLGVRAVLNGHRHLGYRYQPARSPLYLSAPSSTMGCKSGLKPYFWGLIIDDDVDVAYVAVDDLQEL